MHMISLDNYCKHYSVIPCVVKPLMTSKFELDLVPTAYCLISTARLVQLDK